MIQLKPGRVVWLTGLPCSGKMTIGEKLYSTLFGPKKD